MDADAGLDFLIAGRRPATLTLIAAMTLAWAVCLGAGGADGAAALAIDAAGRVAPRIYLGEVWRLVTALFVHLGAAHLLLNCVSLFVFGSFLEDRLGTPRFVAVFLAAGLAGGLLGIAFSTASSVGASGAVVGVYAATLVVLLRFPADESELVRLGVGLSAAVGILLTLLSGALSGAVDNLAHAGGFAAGALFGMALGTRRHGEGLWQWLGAGFLVAALTFASWWALRPDPVSIARYYFIRGGHAYREGDVATAQAEWMRAVAFDPSLADAHFYLALACQAQHDRARARRELATALRLNPDNAEWLDQLGTWNLERDQPAHAEPLFAEVVRLRPQRANAWLSLGRARLQQGKRAGARQAFERALRVEPLNTAVLAALASFWQDLENDAAHARPYWVRLAAMHVADAESVARVARALVELGRAHSAANLLDEHLRRNGPDARLLSLRGTARGELGDFPAAVDDARRALELRRPAPPGKASWSDTFQWARLLFWWRHDGEPAPPAAAPVVRAAMQEALAAAHGPWETSLTRGFLGLLSSDGAAFAERNARAAVRLQPGEADSWYLLGLTLVRQGRAAPAREAFRRASRLAPGDREYAHAAGLPWPPGP